jgi:DNA adenine methylase
MEPTFKLASGSYFGGKGAAGVVHHIINQIPYHQTFISGFLGRCAVMRWKRPASQNIAFDLDAAVIAEWRDAAGVDIKLYRADFLGFIDLLDELQDEDTFLYLDPPYLPETRTSKNQYNFELTHDQHFNMLNKIRELPCRVALSCYDSEMYQVMLHDWRKIQFPAQTRGGPRTETLYMNYPEPTPNQLHDPRFVGTNFRVRERGKRRITTIKKLITRLEPTEKARLMEWLSDLVTSQQPASRSGIA